MKIRILILAVLLSLNFSCKKDISKQEITKQTEIRQWKPEDTRSLNALEVQRGLIENKETSTPGYILFEPTSSTSTYLMDKQGNIVHTWKSEYNSMNSYLLPNGNLMRSERSTVTPTFAAGGMSGIIREYDWDGNIVWEFVLANEKELLHHDIEILPNGNVLAISYEAKTQEEALEAGRNPENVTVAGLWTDKIIEIKPTKPSGGEIVWEWHTWDHLIQDKDSTKVNFGKVDENPRKMDINIPSSYDHPEIMPAEQIDQMKKMGGLASNLNFDNQHSEVSHANAISYNASLDQIVISFKYFNEVYILDHSTTTEEARGSKGGKWGHGGDLLYRWGNPKNYHRGTENDRILNMQHDVKFIPEGYPGAGNLTVFNNDIHNPGNKLPSLGAAFSKLKSPDVLVAIGDFGNYSAVHEFKPPVSKEGTYIIPEDGPIGPAEPLWTYMAPDKYSFYSPFVSGAQRLKSGNTLITCGVNGRLFEVTPENEIVWEYWNQYNDHYTLPDGSPAQPIGPFLYAMFRSTLLPPDYEAFADKDLKPLSPQPAPFVFKMPPPPPPENPGDSVQ
jgi:hypothetical protein